MKTLISKKLKSRLEFPIRLYDERGNQIYEERSDGFWWNSEFDGRGNEIYCENSYDYWEKREYDEKGKKIYYEDSDGRIIDNRPKEVKEVTMEELEKHFNCKVKVIK